VGDLCTAIVTYVGRGEEKEQKDQPLHFILAALWCGSFLNKPALKGLGRLTAYNTLSDAPQCAECTLQSVCLQLLGDRDGQQDHSLFVLPSLYHRVVLLIFVTPFKSLLYKLRKRIGGDDVSVKT